MSSTGYGRRRAPSQPAAFKWIDEDALRTPRQQLFEVHLAHRERKLAETLAAYGQHVEGAELNFFVMLARMERVEIRDDVNIERDGLAIENELPETLPCRKASALYPQSWGLLCRPQCWSACRI